MGAVAAWAVVRGAVVGAAGGLTLLSAGAPASAETAPPPAHAPQPAPEALSRLQLFGAAFRQGEAVVSPVPTSMAPPPQTAMAFLPGRGVVAWSVAGKSAAEAGEAEIEAMGLADAHAVQREIDQAAARQARLDADEKQAAAAGRRPAGGVGGGLAVPRVAIDERAGGPALAPNRTARKSDGLGVRSGETLKEKPRLYAFAAASGRAVGFNVLHEDDGWKGAGLTTDRGGFVGQRQAGVAWRRGVVQTSLSYERVKTKTQMIGIQSQKDSRVMLTTTLPPQAILNLFAPRAAP